MSCGIYKITNKENHKIYIGQSVNIEARWRRHKSIPTYLQDKPLYRAFNKYGIDNFTFEIIELCPISSLNDREKYWIHYYDSYNNGYNLTTGGDGNPNNIVKLSDEDIDIIYDLLQNSTMTQREIAHKFNVGDDTISEINHGKTRIREGYKYPLRNNRIINYCAHCGKPIDKTATLCFDCENINRRTVVRPDRERLKQLIRTESFVQIGKQYGVSDNTIRKWCKAENLPIKKKDIKNFSDKEWKEL